VVVETKWAYFASLSTTTMMAPKPEGGLGQLDDEVYRNAVPRDFSGWGLPAGGLVGGVVPRKASQDWTQVRISAAIFGQK